MAELSSDPADLFAPHLHPPSPEVVALSLISRQDFYIAPPVLPAEQKALYKTSDRSSLSQGNEAKLIEVIGEWKDNGKPFYFARYGNGLAYKFRVGLFAAKYPGPVKEYLRKKSAHKLEPFNPSASYVHPSCRVKLKLTVGGKNIAATNGKAQKEIVIISDADHEEGMDEAKEDSSDDEYGSSSQEGRVPMRRTRRTAALPFSPRKTRLRRVNVIDESDESSLEGRPAQRRSKRIKPAKVAGGFDSSSSFSSYRDERKTQSNLRPKKARVKKSVKPAYGHIHNISDVEYESDDEFACLSRHRNVCGKCHEGPAHDLLKKYNRRNGKSIRKKAKDGLDDTEDEAESLNSLGGWVRCLKCPVVAHWRCLSSFQRDEILKAVKEKDITKQAENPNAPDNKIKKRSGLGISESTDFVCGACSKGGVCMGCMEVITVPDAETLPAQTSNVEINKEQRQDQLLFRCFACRRPSHYEHLPRPASLPDDSSVVDIALYYQDEKDWSCADCSSYVYDLDKILAWRPYPPGAVEPPLSPDEYPNYKNHLPREYLVKWVGRSYRRTEWVPHMWLLSTHVTKLKNFIASGAQVELHRGDKRSEVQEDADLLETGATSPDDPVQGPLSHNAFPDAEQHIPLAWRTVDRIMDILLWSPESNSAKTKKRGTQVISDTESAQTELQAEYNAVFESGRQPSQWNTETVTEWESRKKRSITTDDIGDVIWIFVKWDDLSYSEATWDSPPRPGESGYDSFAEAFRRYVQARGVRILKYTEAELQQIGDRPKDEYRLRHRLRNATDLQLGQKPELLLLPFQVDGFNWLCNNWWNHQPSILADEMGLGKTVQIATFLGNIAADYQAIPALVVVPNSTITNWVRELERWAPNLRVVPYYGEANTREIIRKFELYHESPKKGCSHAKFHVLVATYETLLNKTEFTPIFKSQRWEVLIVDEGQRLKCDTSLLFKRMSELKSGHRILMTGTPLNNNIRELFNLMNFLDPENWNNLDALQKEYAKLTEDLVKQLHNLLRPYFLRRVKSEVLQLPPKNEVIVPMSMAPLQREVYRSILSKNVQTLKGLTHTTGSKSAVIKKNVHNILMQLRKCLQHPYLYDDDIEPRGLAPEETHEKLIDASTKFRLLKLLLPKLRARGHRVLLFSQFVIALDIIEDFLQGEGFKYLRLDGNTKSFERQKGMDEFNRPGSDVFIYLLSTRAGGVGINLYTADTVIIFDPDFNPHQDLQAISRAYRYGQKKTCLVFKFMVKESAEERIMQIGKKKLVLDHLIVQKMDDEDSVGEDVQSILTFGAKALFDSEQESRDIVYTDQDIDKLIEKTEQEGEKQEEVKEGDFSFSFAKVWAADKDAMEDIQEDDQVDSWTQTLQKIMVEREKSQMQETTASGRGVRRAAASYKPNYVVDPDGSPGNNKKKLKSKPMISDSSSYSEQSDDESSEKSDAMDVDFMPLLPDEMFKDGIGPPHVINGTRLATEECGLCGLVHGAQSGECFMTDKSENLAEYREMLIKYSNDEPWEDRSAAIKAIDETLHKRGHLGLIAGQPLHPLRAPSVAEASTLLPRAGRGDNQVSGSLKRPGSPADEAAKKKSKPIFTSCCPICNRSPHHLVKDCPVVAAGPQSIAEQLRRLESSGDPAVIQTVDILRNILSKQRKQD